MTLWEAYRELPAPEGDGEASFRAALLPHRGHDFIAKSSRQSPAFLLHITSSELERIPVVLKHLRVSFDVSCRLTLEGGRVMTETFCIVECLSSESPIQMSFIAAVGSMIESMPESPTRRQVLECIQAIVEAFRKLELPSPATIRGLWGELFSIDLAKQPHELISCWHDDRVDRFDFAVGAHRLEIKSAEGQLRIHEFSLGQLRPESDVAVCIGSVQLQTSSAGLTVLDLARRIHDKISDSPESTGRLWRQVFGTLVADDLIDSELRFDLAHARATFLLVDGASIPCPIIPQGTPITNVRFQVALSALGETPQGRSVCAFWAERFTTL